MTWAPIGISAPVRVYRWIAIIRNASMPAATLTCGIGLHFPLTYAIPGVKGYAQLLEGWQVNSIVSLFGAQPWGVIDTGTDLSETGEGVDRWDFIGSPSDFKATMSTGIPWIANTNFVTDTGGNVIGVAPGAPAALRRASRTPVSKRLLTNSRTGVATRKGNSVMTPPAPGTFGTMGRNIFRDFGFRNVDFSTVKNVPIRRTPQHAVPRGVLQPVQPSELCQSVWRPKRLGS